MSLYSVDVSQVHTLTIQAVRMLDGAPLHTQAVLDRRANENRASHVYQNITNRLQGSTFAMGPVTFGIDAYGTEFGARMDYASHVEDRGRNNIREIAMDAAQDLTGFFQQQADIISGY